MEEQQSDLPIAHVAALSQMARFAPDAFEQKSDVVMTYLVKRIIMIPSPVDAVSVTDLSRTLHLIQVHKFKASEDDDEEEWVEDDEIPDELRAKVLSLKVCRNRCMSHSSSKSAVEIATPVLKLLATLVEYEGSLSTTVEEE